MRCSGSTTGSSTSARHSSEPGVGVLTIGGCDVEQSAAAEQAHDLARDAEHHLGVLGRGAIAVAAPARVGDAVETLALQLERGGNQRVEIARHQRGQRSQHHVDPR